MRIMGVDPGTIHMGWGVIDYDEDTIHYRGGGVIKVPRSLPLPRRLGTLYGLLAVLMDRSQPGAVAVESAFVGINPRTALAIGQAQAIPLIVADTRSVKVIRNYTPTEVKRAATSYGGSGKTAVAHMVGLLLTIDTSEMGLDETDALAVAICHANATREANLLEERVLP